MLRFRIPSSNAVRISQDASVETWNIASSERIDTAAEFAAKSNYFYTTYSEVVARGAPPRQSRPRELRGPVIVLGSGVYGSEAVLNLTVLLCSGIARAVQALCNQS